MMENKTKIDLKNKSVFITGVAGFIGSKPAKRPVFTGVGVNGRGLGKKKNNNDERDEERRLN